MKQEFEKTSKHRGGLQSHPLWAEPQQGGWLGSGMG